MTAKKSGSKQLSIGELAREAGVSADTIRHYERKGVIARPERAANGYRCYPPASLSRLHLVRRALAVGFTLHELARVFRMRDGGGIPCAEVRALAAAKLSEIEVRLDELVALRDELRATLSDWDAQLERTPAGRRAGLLESLSPSRRAAAKRAPFSANHKRKRIYP